MRIAFCEKKNPCVRHKLLSCSGEQAVPCLCHQLPFFSSLPFLFERAGKATLEGWETNSQSISFILQPAGGWIEGEGGRRPLNCTVTVTVITYVWFGKRDTLFSYQKVVYDMKEKGAQCSCSCSCFINAILSLFDGPTPSIYKSFLENCGTFWGRGRVGKGLGLPGPNVHRKEKWLSCKVASLQIRHCYCYSRKHICAMLEQITLFFSFKQPSP